MAELADALDSGSSDFTVIQVQVLLPAPSKSLENTEFSRLFLFRCHTAFRGCTTRSKVRNAKCS